MLPKDTQLGVAGAGPKPRQRDSKAVAPPTLLQLVVSNAISVLSRFQAQCKLKSSPYILLLFPLRSPFFLLDLGKVHSCVHSATDIY